MLIQQMIKTIYTSLLKKYIGKCEIPLVPWGKSLRDLQETQKYYFMENFPDGPKKKIAQSDEKYKRADIACLSLLCQSYLSINHNFSLDPGFLNEVINNKEVRVYKRNLNRLPYKTMCINLQGTGYPAEYILFNILTDIKGFYLTMFVGTKENTYLLDKGLKNLYHIWINNEALIHDEEGFGYIELSDLLKNENREGCQIFPILRHENTKLFLKILICIVNYLSSPLPDIISDCDTDLNHSIEITPNETVCVLNEQTPYGNTENRKKTSQRKTNEYSVGYAIGKIIRQGYSTKSTAKKIISSTNNAIAFGKGRKKRKSPRVHVRRAHEKYVICGPKDNQRKEKKWIDECLVNAKNRYFIEVYDKISKQAVLIKWKGEQKIAEYCIIHNIVYEQQKRVYINEELHIFDFCFEYNKDIIFIEYDGIEHFRPVEFFGGEKMFLERKRKDQIKDEYCRKNGYRLIRISYKEYANIALILQKELNISESDY